MIERNGLSSFAVRKQEEERQRKQQRIDFALKSIPEVATQVASHEVSYKKQHYQSMSDALKEVRKSNVTHADTTQVTRPNSKGL